MGERGCGHDARRGCPLYLDAAATTPLHPRVLSRIREALAAKAGRGQAEARDRAAELVGVVPEAIWFVPSGSAANNAVLRLAADGGWPVVSQPSEHPSVLRPLKALEARGHPVHWLGLRSGRVDPGELERVLGSPGTRPVLVSIMAVNHETGLRQPVEAIGEVCRQRGALFHCDAVQAWRTLDVDPSGPHYLSLSAHKLEGPKGVAALVVDARAPRPQAEFDPGPALLEGFVAALELRRERGPAWRAALEDSRDALQERLAALPGARVHGSGPRAPGHLCVSFAGFSGDALVSELDLQGIACSSGSACSSGAGEPSPVLLATGASAAEATGSLRFSLVEPLLGGDVEHVARCLERALRRLAELAP
ncbi:MAG: aminotransferase class V-fold PLP-dependent enzyme [Planctomycetota bacterium]|nr:MAG: aminotransferase class V-fold PLP-dependent enzyme [Planctomycetota bacterium]